MVKSLKLKITTAHVSPKLSTFDGYVHISIEVVLHFGDLTVFCLDYYCYQALCYAPLLT